MSNLENRIKSTWDLLKTPAKQRDSDWENQFLTSLPEAHVRVISPEPQVGPDGWPYLFIEVKESSFLEGAHQLEPSDIKIDSNQQEVEPLRNVLSWLSERGIGLVINPEKEFPDYVLSYGALWHFRHHGSFEPVGNSTEASREDFKLDANKEVKIKKVFEMDLPSYARKIIREFLRDQGVYFPKVLMVNVEGGEKFDFAFSLESLGQPPQEELPGILEALGWFFPQSATLTILRESHLPHFEML